jgi:hypothetical protein
MKLKDHLQKYQSETVKVIWVVEEKGQRVKRLEKSTAVRTILWFS